MSRPSEVWADLVARGCLCGSDNPERCPIHTSSGDNRGIAAWFKAGMPTAFPFDALCSECGTEGLIYPNIEIDDPKRSGEYRRTLICPHCSGPGAEASLVADAIAFGHELNDRRVFLPSGAAA